MLHVSNGLVVAGPPVRLRLTLTGFFLLAVALSWAGAAPMVASTWIDAETSPPTAALVRAAAPLQLLMFFGPLLAALAAAAVNYGRSGLRSLLGTLLRAPPFWLLAAFAGPAIVTATTVLLARRAGGGGALTGTAVVSALEIFAIYMVLNTEELAWRGYALPQLQGRLSPLFANLTLSFLWALFHAPLFLAQGGHPAGYGPGLFLVLVLAIGLVAGAVFNATGGSVLVTHVFHQSLNGWGEGLRIFPVMNDGSEWPMAIFTTLCAFIALVAVRHLRALDPKNQDSPGSGARAA